MRSCALSILLFALMIVGFIVGALANQPGLLMVSVIASPLVWFVGGWSARGLFTGRRLSFVAVEPTVGRGTRRAPERVTAEQTL